MRAGRKIQLGKKSSGLRDLIKRELEQLCGKRVRRKHTEAFKIERET